MADTKATEKTITSPKPASASGAESPTTARELDFDDEPQDDSSHAHAATLKSASPKPRVSFQDEAPPPKPPRPMSPQAQAMATLMEAFPDTDAKVVKAVLVASGGKVEPAFNALLSMSDPDFREEQAPPPQPPRPAQPPQARSQIEQDELYARQLAEHYQTSQHAPGFGSRERGDPPIRRRQDTNLKPNELYDKDHSFFDDDLPVIRQQFEKGFQETKATVNKWFMNLQKRIDGDDQADLEEHDRRQQRQNYGPSQSEQMYGIRKSADRSRRSGDMNRYDADNRVLGDDFAHLEMRDDEAPQRRQGGRPLANPDLFKATPAPPQGGPVDEVEALYSDPSANNRQPSPGNARSSSKKWQPLTSVAPHPETEDNDPFSLGDSDDDKDKDLKAEDSERLKKAASQSGPSGKAGPEAAERSGSLGTRDKAAEELLTGKKS